MIQLPAVLPGVKRSGFINIPADELLGFKALPSPTFDIKQSTTPSNWTGIYPQLSLTNAISYLPNQYDRGCESAVVVSLKTMRDIRILLLVDDSISDPNLSEHIKAQIARNLISTHVTNFSPDTPLMDECGLHGIILCLPDATGFEVIIPHSLFNSDWFSMEIMYEFSFGIWANVSQVKDLTVPKHILDDYDALGHYLTRLSDDQTCFACVIINQINNILIT
ncbi:hypothetical protein BC833DRAFT_661900 [Globomyces pollinis-pini]|nr:hypothetical protein BC833DRAFT_661900 [Globomyces pollinis-pini]